MRQRTPCRSSVPKTKCCAICSCWPGNTSAGVTCFNRRLVAHACSAATARSSPSDPSAADPVAIVAAPVRPGSCLGASLQRLIVRMPSIRTLIISLSDSCGVAAGELCILRRCLCSVPLQALPRSCGATRLLLVAERRVAVALGLLRKRQLVPCISASVAWTRQRPARLRGTHTADQVTAVAAEVLPPEDGSNRPPRGAGTLGATRRQRAPSTRTRRYGRPLYLPPPASTYRFTRPATWLAAHLPGHNAHCHATAPAPRRSRYTSVPRYHV